MGCTGSTPIVSDFLGQVGTASLDDMPVLASLTSRTRRTVGEVLTLVSLVAVVAGFALVQTVESEPMTSHPSFSTAATPSAANRLVLRFDGRIATGTLDDTPAAREFADMLPLTLQLSDPMGQAKSGPLPLGGSLGVTGEDRTFPDQRG